MIDREVKQIIDDAYVKCEEMLRAHMKELTAVAEYLIKYESMDGETFERLFSGEEVDAPPHKVSFFTPETKAEAVREEHAAKEEGSDALPPLNEQH